MDDQLTTTSYAILGQLALRSWTTYELTREIRRNFHYFWPRAESRIYAEVKRLANRGLVRADRDFVGQRPRTTYSMTDEGNRALTEWLATPPKPYALEFEGLLRLFFARLGTTEQLLDALDQTATQAEELLLVGAGIAREYHEGRAPFQEEIDLRAFVFDFLYSYAKTMKGWADRTRAEIVARQDLSAEERATRALEIIDRALNR